MVACAWISLRLRLAWSAHLHSKFCQAELQKWDPASKNKNKNKQSKSPWFDDMASQVRTLAVQTW